MEPVSGANRAPPSPRRRYQPRMASPETADATASVSAFLLRPVRPLPEFVAELRHRLDRLPVRAGRADLAAMVAAAEREIGYRQRRR